MVWGSKSPKIEARPSAISQLLPLVIFLVFLGGLAFVGYHIYLSVAKIQEDASQGMAKRNMVFSKDGLKVGVKHYEQEKYVDNTQSWVVKAWNMGTHTPVKRK